jgi:glycosyltransferase involved in cell wall biosynthesis
MRVALVASSVPRKCGIATFTSDVMAAVKAADPDVRVTYIAIDQPGESYAYGPEVKRRIRQGDEESYRAAARYLNESNVEVVNVQHEFGLYGKHGPDGWHDHLVPFLDELHKPVVTTLHTVLPQPEPWMRDSIRAIADRSTALVVMVETAARLLRTVYGISKHPLVIPHGMPAVQPTGRHRFKKQFGVQDKQLISTFGLVDPRKGLEYVIEAMPRVVEAHPNTIYFIVGQTHPELLRHEGEAYRNRLQDLVRSVGMSEHVTFVNEYLTQRQIVDYLLASDIYVTPYLDPNQITSGTLAYALGAGKAIVSTRYLHAVEALGSGRGILCDFRDATGLGNAILAILGDPQLKSELEERAYRYGKQMAWPEVGKKILATMRHLVSDEVVLTELRDEAAREDDAREVELEVELEAGVGPTA